MLWQVARESTRLECRFQTFEMRERNRHAESDGGHPKLAQCYRRIVYIARVAITHPLDLNLAKEWCRQLVRRQKLCWTMGG